MKINRPVKWLSQALALSTLGVRRGGGRSAGLRPRGSRNLRLHALLTALLLALGGVLVVPVAASAAEGDVGFEGPSHSGTGTPTGSKRATSALWFNDGLWWGNLWDTASSDFHIFRFNAASKSWVDTGVATDPRANTHHDVLWDGTTLYVASYRFVADGVPAEVNFPTTMRRYSYSSSTKTYSLLAQSPTNINNYRVEALTIDKDSTGRVWATWQQANRIYLNATGTDGKTWGTPFQHPASLSNVSLDDTSALIAFGQPGKMGVMWSRQVGGSTDGMYWSYRADSVGGAPNTGWSTPVAAVSGQGSSDDHMNLKWLDSSGDRVFAAVKTSFTSAPQPLIQLLALNGTTWSAHTIAPVSECPNRVIVLIDESSPKRLRTFATYPKPSGTTNAGVCTTSGGAIYEKSAPLDDPGKLATATKTASIVDADQYVHNVTSTKQNLNSGAWGTANSGLLLLADVNATSRYWHSYDPSGGGDTTAPTVTATSPTANETGVAVTADVTGTFSEAIDASTVTATTFTLTGPTGTVQAAYSSTGNVATLNPTANLAAGTTGTPYTATIKGGPAGVRDLAGNPLATDRTWTFTTAPAGGGDTTAPTVTATSPTANETGVAVTADVTGTFSEAIDASTVTATTFTLTGPTGTVQAAYSSTGNVATLNPTANLAAGTTGTPYTATIKGGPAGVRDLAGNPLATDRTWTFTTAPAGGGTPETVTLTATADSYVSSAAPGTNNGTSTLLGVDNSPAEVTYLKFDLSAYAGRTIQSATLQLRSAGSGSTGTQNIKLVADDNWTETGITYSGTPIRPTLGTSIGTLGPTTTNTTYNIPLTVSGLTGELGQQLSLGMDTSSGDGLDLNSKEAGSTLAPKLVLTLSGGGGGDTTAPTVTATSPTANETGVAVTADVTGTFSEAIDASTVTATTFTLTGPTGTVQAAYSSTGNVATLNPTANLAAGTTGTPYTATIKGGPAGVRDLAGNPLATDRTWTFTTAPAGGGDTTAPTVTATSPTANETGVAVTADVTGTFSEAIDASTVTATTFTLTGPTGTVQAAYSSTGNVATLNPTANLAAGTTGTPYTATIKGGPAGVRDLAGNPLATDRTWTFTTAPAGGGTPETVTLTATADSYVSSAAPGTNNGTSTLLGVDNSPAEVTYLKFDLSAYAGRTIQSATLQLRSAGSGSTGTQNIKLVADDNWTETGITYSGTPIRPTLGTSIGTLGPTTTNTTYNIPLTVSGLTGELGQQLSLGMDTSSGDGLDLNSKEAGSTLAPKLVLTLS
ncbi:Ig-like domain-containing protein [Pseudarthrobacter sp. SSS035]|uniref:Ig-like domain-containing protein n=1 Tax=Pseudarthrobacter sp. SSS035 TaxID=2931399 RepID=UPI0020105558|nr:Ig-like domain-containing protein [Pseudarthrobacter sp. SSS035]